MPLPRNGFEPQFEEVRGGAPALGKAALLPWDTEIFGFPVALFRVGDEAPDNAIRKDVAPHFSSWMMHHEVSVCGCVLPAGNVFWKSFLPTLGFRFVDFAIEARLRDLSSATLPPVRAVLRNPQRGDRGPSKLWQHGHSLMDATLPIRYSPGIWPSVGINAGLQMRWPRQTAPTAFTSSANQGA